MLKSISAFALAMLMCAPALADGMDYAPRRYYPQRFYLPPEQHVIEVEHLRDVVRQRLVVVSKTVSVPHTRWGLNELQREGAAGG